MRRIALWLVTVGVFVVVAPAQAAIINVTTTADSPNSNPVGSCFPGSCTLREAVKDADDSSGIFAGPDTIRLPPGTYSLPNDALKTLGPGESITSDITIEGTGGANVTTITGADTTDNVTPGGGVFAVVTPGKLTIRGVTISGNRLAGTASTTGGAIAAEVAPVVIENSVVRDNRNDGVPSSNGAAGGGLGVNNSPVTITDSAIEQNLWLGSSAVNAAGGVLAANSFAPGVTITRSSVSRNRADPPSGTSTFVAGGVHVSNGVALTISDSTVSQNSARAASSAFRAGGVLTLNNPPQPATPAITLTNATVTDNTTAPGGSFAVGNVAFIGVAGSTEPRVVRNSIVAGGLPVNCAIFGPGAITSSGGNLEDANTCNFTGPGDLVNTASKLAALQFTGGLGLSQEPLSNSPALGLARPAFCSALDQTGLARPQGGGCDSGAVETAAPPVNTALPAISGTPAGGQTLTCSPGTFTENPTTSIAWLSDGAVVGSGSTFTIGDAQLDTAIQCRVTATNFKGSTVATSAAVVAPKPVVQPPAPPPTAPAAPVNTARPRFTGTPRTGQRLTCSQGTFTGAASFALAWLRNGTRVASGATYTLVAADAGKAIQCQVTATGPGGSVVAESAPAVSAKACVVPTMVGKTLAAAKKALTAANCAAGKATTRKSTKKPGTVISSSPAKGKNLAAGSKVALTVAKK